MKAYSPAQSSFETGTITNPDLIDADSPVSQTGSLLLKVKFDYAARI